MHPTGAVFSKGNPMFETSGHLADSRQRLQEPDIEAPMDSDELVLVECPSCHQDRDEQEFCYTRSGGIMCSGCYVDHVREMEAKRLAR